MSAKKDESKKSENSCEKIGEKFKVLKNPWKSVKIKIHEIHKNWNPGKSLKVEIH